MPTANNLFLFLLLLLHKIKCTDCQSSCSCESCTPGRKKASGGCENCLPGFFSDTSAAEICLECPMGYVQTSSSGLFCLPCIPGTFNKQRPPIMCEKCSVGTYAAEQNATFCTICGIGKSSKRGRALCKECQPGKYGSAPGICKQCAENEYNDIRGELECKSCPVGKSPNKLQSGCERPEWKLPEDCEPKIEYLDDKSSVKEDWKCITCPTGVDCSKPSKFSSLTMISMGYFNATWGEQPSFYLCVKPENCQATNTSAKSINNKTTPCLHNTYGILCAECLPNYYIENDVCISCQGVNFKTYWQLTVLLVTLISVTILFQIYKKRARRLYKKFGRDIIRILTINLGFAQINSSVPSIINIPWPDSYVNYVRGWDFVNFQWTTLFNVSCSGSGWDYRATVAVACAVPFVVILLFSFLFLVKRCRAFSKLKKGLSKTALVDIAENMFSYMDKNVNGCIEEFELHQILKVTHSIPDDETFDTSDPLIIDLRLKLIGEGDNTDEGLSEKLFVNAFAQNNFGNTDIGKNMIEWAVVQKVRSSILSGFLLVLFCLHAPISQRIFHYFVCHEIDGRTFLTADYTISCDSDMYKNFRILPIVMLAMFTAGFPVVIFLLLFINRNRLHTPSVKAHLGFLYSAFRPKRGEFWEVHELLRKLMLMGTLVLLKSVRLKMVVALLVCVVSVANLNYFKPHRNPIVQKVAQASFLLTTCKYVLAIALVDVSETEREVLGGVLVFLDICFVLGSLGSIVAVLYLLKSHLDPDVESKWRRRFFVAAVRAREGLSKVVIKPTNGISSSNKTRTIEL